MKNMQDIMLNFPKYVEDKIVFEEIPDCVTNIGYCAFSECENLASINIPSSLKQLGSDCLYDTPSLYTIIIPGPLSCDSVSFDGTFFDADGNCFEI